MEENITLTAENKDALNQLIDIKLKEGYLILGPMQADKQGQIAQVMTLPRNIDDELTMGSVVRSIIMLLMMGTVLYFTF